MAFRRFPYSNFHDINMDWIINKINTIPTKISQLINDTGFITREQAPVQSVNGQTGNVIVSGTGAVDSVNGQTGAVVLTAVDVGAKPASYAAPVDSVNGQTGAVTLTAADVGAKPANYAAPVDSVNGKTGAVVLNAADVGSLANNAIDTQNITSTVTTFDVDPDVEIASWMVMRSGKTVMVSLWFHTSAAKTNDSLLLKFRGVQNAINMTSSTYNPLANSFGAIGLSAVNDTVEVKTFGNLPAAYYWMFTITFIST